MRLGELVSTPYGKGRIEGAQADETIIVRLPVTELIDPERCITQGEDSGLFWFYREELK